MSEIADRLVKAGEAELERRLGHEDVPEHEWEPEARAVVVAVLRELARPMQVGGTGILPMEPVWYPVPLFNLANEIEGERE